jgi:hypothetical protein
MSWGERRDSDLQRSKEETQTKNEQEVFMTMDTFGHTKKLVQERQRKMKAKSAIMKSVATLISMECKNYKHLKGSEEVSRGARMSGADSLYFDPG